ncbi:serine protease [Oceaniglobus indicus]|uniref:serine protease n=1 Tax=Oceaniglobus indicus TaxID=2047749 RepID=UPI000C185F3E|nr:serine protease [Oceaniglobus indicus]
MIDTLKSLPAAAALLGLSLAASPGLTQDAGPVASPFAFAESDMKAEQRKTAAAAREAAGGKVIGGKIAADGAWPWQVALMVAGRGVSPDSQFCGGSMILDQWVLTASHCIFMPDQQNGGYFQLDPSQFAVLVGTNVLAEGQGDLVPVAGVFRNPNYVGGEFDNDVALIKLARKPNANYQTITVPDSEFGDILDQQGVPTIVTGWGLTEGGANPAEMREAEIQIIDRDACNGAMLEARAQVASRPFSEAVDAFGLGNDDAQAAWQALVDRAPRPLTQNMLCSGTFEGGKTSCSGDSGGPLVVPLEDGTYIQAGVVAWGLTAENGGCLETAIFSAYTKVANYLPWLEQTIAQN